jgi:putative ABC transport system permease protein
MKVVLRNVSRHKGFSFINITGLAIGMACCLLITIWVLDELSFDKFHRNAPSLFRVEEDLTLSGRIYHGSTTPFPLGPALKEDFPEIIQATRFVEIGQKLFRYKDMAFFEDNIIGVDPSFLQMFSFPLLQGDRETALSGLSGLIISENISEKYFDDKDPLGEVITLNNEYDFVISGVMANVPHNSTLQFDILLPYEFLKQTGQTIESWYTSRIDTYVQLSAAATREQVNLKIKDYLQKYIKDVQSEYTLMPLTRIHLHAYTGYGRDIGAVKYVYIFTAIALFVLLIACINFMNLTTARSVNRAKEIGVRKVIGATRTHLIRQFYGESIFYACLALGFAVTLVQLLFPALTQITGKDTGLQTSSMGHLFLALLGITVLTGIVAGSYPALFLSSFQPVKILQGKMKSARSSILFRRILVTIQFSLSVFLIIGTFVVYNQLNFMKTKSVGFDREHLIYIPMEGGVNQKYGILREEFKKDSRIIGISASNFLPSNIQRWTNAYNWEGKDPELDVLMARSSVDFEYINTTGIKILEGRSFSRDYETDKTEAFIINEEAAKLMEKPSAVGESFQLGDRKGRIIGIMEDFHFASMRTQIQPLVVAIYPENFRFILIRIAAENVPSVLNSAEKIWKRIIPNCPFAYSFLNENFRQMYEGEERVSTILKYFAFMAILIACLGLFGLASFSVEQRTKEIGIRKVLGASGSQISNMLFREFIILVLLANIIAWPAAFFILEGWLQNFAYRVGIGWLPFVLAALVAATTAMVSVSLQAIKAARGCPAKALRYE